MSKSLRFTLTTLVALALTACAGPAAPAATLPPPSIATATALPPAPTATLTVPAPTATTIPLPSATPTPAFDPFALTLAPAAVSFDIPPAFQRVDEASAVLYFELDPPTAGEVLYRAQGGPLQSVPFSADEARHTVTLSGLAPSATYDVMVAVGAEPDYQLPLFEEAVWGVQTISIPPYTEPLRFAAIADSGFGDPTTARLAQMIAAQQPQFVMLPGDVVYRVEEQRDPAEAWRLKYFAPFAPVLRQAPIYPAVGNHEFDAASTLNGIPYYFTAFPPVFDTTFPAFDGQPLRKWYAFSYSGIQFLSLNSQALFGDEGRAEQEAWLDERLADTSYAYTVAFFHVPPFSSAMHYADGRNVQSWADKFEASGVPLVIGAHDHVYERLSRGGTTYIVSGGGSATVYGIRVPNEFSQMFASVSHFTQFDAYPDRIEVSAIDLDGALIDQLSIPIAGP